MEKAQSQTAELSLAYTKDSTTNTSNKFFSTSNPRQLRVLHALLRGPLTREQLDRVAGASNGPEVVAQLRRGGLTLPCRREPVFDRDGQPIKRGVYYFTDDDRREVCKSLGVMGGQHG
jgi:hypothetical protein